MWERFARGFPVVLLAAGCAGMGAGRAGGPSGVLEIRMPEGESIGYMRADTTRISVDAGMGEAVEMSLATQTNLGLEFVDEADGVRVTARFEEFAGRMTNPMVGPITATQEDIRGDLVFKLDGRGRPEVLQLPEVDDEADQLVRAAFLPYELFPRLPDGPVEAGDAWTDTTHIARDRSGVSSASTYITTYTLRGDTLVEARRLLRIDFATAIEMKTSGESGGFEVQQEMTGESVGTLLWDPDRSLMVRSEDRTSLSGTVNVPAAGMPTMALQSEGTSRTILRRP